MVITLGALTLLSTLFVGSFVITMRYLIVFLFGGTTSQIALLGRTATITVSAFPEWVTLGLSVVVTAAIFAVLAYLHQWNWDPTLRLFTIDLKHPPEEIEQRITRLAKRLDISTPAIQLMDTDVPTAFTTGVRTENAPLTISRGLVDQLSDEELTEVLAHELSHIKNRDVAVMTLVMVPVVIAEGLWTIATPETKEDSDGKPKTDYGFEGPLLAIIGVLAGLGSFRRIAVEQQSLDPPLRSPQR